MTAPTTDEEVRRLFRGIRRAPGATARFSPHKPLLLLLALARVQRGEARLFGFAEVEDQLKTLLGEFGPSSAPQTRHLPYWHLHTDQDGRLWDLSLPASLAHQPRATAPGLRALRQVGVEAGFPRAVERVLAARPHLVVELARELLEQTFPPTLHQDVAAAVGLDVTEQASREPGAAYAHQRPAPRDRTFRERVLRAYEYRCCVCGFDLRIGHIPAGLEAAHIQWHTAGGPDIEPNGLSLCALHHKLFDLGAFSLVPESLTIVFSQHALSGTRGLTGELRHHGSTLLPPAITEARPAARFIEWNRKNVFKNPIRSQ